MLNKYCLFSLFFLSSFVLVLNSPPVSCGSRTRMVLRCFICEEPFISASDLIEHDKTHNEEKPTDPVKQKETLNFDTTSDQVGSKPAPSDDHFNIKECKYLKGQKIIKKMSEEKTHKCDMCNKIFRKPSKNPVSFQAVGPMSSFAAEI